MAKSLGGAPGNTVIGLVQGVYQGWNRRACFRADDSQGEGGRLASAYCSRGPDAAPYKAA